MKSFFDLEQRVAATGGLACCSMEDLRDMVGAGKLGAGVRDEIGANLDRVGLGVLGRKLPKDQTHPVWLIAKRRPDGKLLVELLELMGVAA